MTLARRIPHASKNLAIQLTLGNVPALDQARHLVDAAPRLGMNDESLVGQCRNQLVSTVRIAPVRAARLHRKA